MGLVLNWARGVAEALFTKAGFWNVFVSQT